MIRAQDANKLVQSATEVADRAIVHYLEETCAPLIERAARAGCALLVLPVGKDIDQAAMARVLHQKYGYVTDTGSVTASSLAEHNKDPYATREWARWPFHHDQAIACVAVAPRIRYCHSTVPSPRVAYHEVPDDSDGDALEVAETGRTEEVYVPSVRIKLSQDATMPGNRPLVIGPPSLGYRLRMMLCCCFMPRYMPPTSLGYEM